MDVSVVIITYNQDQYIKNTIESIVKQNFEGEMEIVIGDDCSNDCTREILFSMAKEYPGIIKPIFNEKNLGIVKNYYNVVSQCTGKYIMVCGGDDYWLPGKMELQYQLMERESSIGVCYGLAKKIFDGSLSPSNETVGGKSTSFEALMHENKIPACTSCIRRDLLEKYIEDVNPLDKEWKMEDYPTWLWFSKHSNIYFINETLAVYRVIKNSASHKFDVEKRIAFYQSVFSVKRAFCDEYEKKYLLQEYNTLKSLYFLKGKNSFFKFAARYDLKQVARDKILIKFPLFLRIRNRLFLNAVKRMK